MSKLVDQFQRKFEYLRLSVTDVCNFKCTYCLPNGYHREHKKQFLSLVEISNLVQGFAQLGTKKVRITGGEPSLRRDFADIIETVKNTQGIEKVATTTNGFRMAKSVADWKAAGLDAINVSMDSLDANMFHQITGENLLTRVMAGIDAAFAAGFSQVKVNTVLMKRLNAHELDTFLAWIKPRNIQLRFIELMQTGDNHALFQAHHISGSVIMKQLINQGWVEKVRQATDGPARVFCHSDYSGEIGLIMPYESHFCDSCNRLRVSSLGRLHLCLFGEQGTELRDLLQTSEHSEALQQRLMEALKTKRTSHFLQQGELGGTVHLASIGG
ncbi:GTP 3',8-cyclase MoaA [Motilimonas sp. 1_MG-2023]|uniref:GTP 3',8-cyclase MoaA n=1 Tax=Motilimonas sp. 1_MG-2023 TaxID=3062672 RepID=UPI0026E2521B|nr:GTP 3',8-cyclase MoaA [Motilimonas sp. 1_MG-2023]MDO6526523.1 GTP 3',8-cyclase MoaA [Motilimonas sp. 1_MG-2023]